MQSTSNAVTEKVAEKSEVERMPEKLAEKRRALGRGLESLLPGPRVVVAPSVVEGSPHSIVEHSDGGRAGAPVSPSSRALDGDGAALGVDIQAVAAGGTADGAQVFQLAIDQVDHNPYQTRERFELELLEELAESIKVQGVLQPIVVRPGKEGRFILILGERRLRAAKLAGQTTIPVIVKRVSEQQAAEMTLVENLQRQDLNCVEMAEAFANLSKEFKLTQEEIGKRAGVSREQVSNYMRLLALPEGVIGALQKGRLTFSHARVLLQLRNNVEIWKLAQKAIEEKMSVAKLEDLVFGVSAPVGGGEPKTGGGARWVDPNVKAAQRLLEEVLGMRVRIRDRRGRGKIVIEYGTLDDFDRVVGMLKGKAPVAGSQ